MGSKVCITRAACAAIHCCCCFFSCREPRIIRRLCALRSDWLASCPLEPRLEPPREEEDAVLAAFCRPLIVPDTVWWYLCAVSLAVVNGDGLLYGGGCAMAPPLQINTDGHPAGRQPRAPSCGGGSAARPLPPGRRGPCGLRLVEVIWTLLFLV